MPRPCKTPPVKYKSPKFKYRTITDAMQDLIAEYMTFVGKAPVKSLYQKYSKLIAEPFQLDTLYVYLAKYGASQAKRMVGLSGRNIARNPEARAEQVRSMVQIAAEAKRRLQEKAIEHTERAIAEVDKVHKVLEKRKLNNKNVGQHLWELDKWDSIARRTFHMDEEEPVSSHTLNVALLCNLKAEDLSPISSRTPLELTETSSEALEPVLRVETAETAQDRS
jgi:hypothetical protein